MEKNKPLVSIIIPVYNGSNYLTQAIDSALAQTYENIEVLVINDGSTDEGATEQIALSYGNRIRYISKTNGGVASALNVGIEHMMGTYFSWLSHDDMYSPTKISNAINAIEQTPEPHRTIVVCDLELIDAKGNAIYRPVKKSIQGLFIGKDVFLKVINGLSIGGCNLLIPKEIFDTYGGFRDLKTVQDMDCWIRFMLNDCQFLFIVYKDVKSRIHDQQDGRRLKHLIQEEKNILGKNITDALKKNNAPPPLWAAHIRQEMKLRNLKSVEYIQTVSGKSYFLETVVLLPFYFLLWTTRQCYYWVFIHKKWKK